MEYNSHFLILSSVRRKTSPVQENHCKMLCFKGANFGWASEVSKSSRTAAVLRGKERSVPSPNRGCDISSPLCHAFPNVSFMQWVLSRGASPPWGHSGSQWGLFCCHHDGVDTAAFIRYKSGIPRDSLLTRDSHHIPHDFQTSSLTSV